MDSQIPFFCGDSTHCRTLGSKQALNEAIENIEESFLVVGILEIFEESLEVLECKLPQYFKVSHFGISKPGIPVIYI